MKRRFHTLDVFTQNKLQGNPLAVVLDSDGLTDQQMQTIAGEFNLSETVFVTPPEISAHKAALRIFTPTHELPFAGHPTIGTAILLASLESVEYEGEIVLEEKAGLVPVQVKTGKALGSASFKAPGVPEFVRPQHNRAMLAAALGLTESDIGFDNHEPVFAELSSVRWLFAPVRTADALAQSAPDMSTWMAAHEEMGIVGVYAYTNQCVSSEASYHARMFAPHNGILEDPATGSAAATFPGALLEAESLPDGEHDWLVEQGYEMGRPSQISLSANVDAGKVTSVHVAGSAVRILEGSLDF